MASLNKYFSPLCRGSLNNLLVRVPVRNHVGYMPFEGPLVPKTSPSDILQKELLKINLKPVTRYTFFVCSYTLLIQARNGNKAGNGRIWQHFTLLCLLQFLKAFFWGFFRTVKY